MGLFPTDEYANMYMLSQRHLKICQRGCAGTASGTHEPRVEISSEVAEGIIRLSMNRLPMVWR